MKRERKRLCCECCELYPPVVLCFSTQLPQVMTISDCVSRFCHFAQNRDDPLLHDSSVSDGNTILPNFSYFVQSLWKALL